MPTLVSITKMARSERVELPILGIEIRCRSRAYLMWRAPRDEEALT